MKGRLVLAVLLAALGVALYYGWSRFHAKVVAAEAVLEQPPRLAPDRRYLIALGDLDRIAGRADSMRWIERNAGRGGIAAAGS